MMKTLDISLWPPRAHIFMNTHTHISVRTIHTENEQRRKYWCPDSSGECTEQFEGNTGITLLEAVRKCLPKAHEGSKGERLGGKSRKPELEACTRSQSGGVNVCAQLTGSFLVSRGPHPWNGAQPMEWCHSTGPI